MITAVRALGWGIYCASSWTWCIGMFLPVVLLDRYGWWGFLFFAIPNVLGCAAMGYLIGSGARSVAMVHRHLMAMRWFSRITIVYHAFFVAFIAYVIWPETAGHVLVVPGAVAVLLIAAGVLRMLPLATWPAVAAGAYLVSLNTLFTLGTEPLAEIAWTGARGVADIVWLGPVIAIGFLCCPWLDLTFHRARQASGTPHTFGVFGLTFAVMIVMTCIYATAFPSQLPAVVLAHLAVQSVFTVGAHWRELAATAPVRQGGGTTDGALLFIVCLVVAGMVWLTALADDRYAAGVDWYLRILVFYGLVFPVYVVWWMRPGAAPLNHRGMRACALGIGFALPMFEAGFIHGYAWLPAPALLVVLTAGAMLTRSQRAGGSTAAT